MQLEPLKELTLKNLLRRSARVFAQLPALSEVDSTPVTYAELLSQIQRISQFLRHQGIVTGDRVAILSENKPNWGIAFFAITTMGAVAVPILPEFHPNEIHHILRHSGCKAIFVSERLYAKIEEGQFDTLSTILLIDDFSVFSSKPKQEKKNEPVPERKKDRTKLHEDLSGISHKPSIREDIASIIYQAGTTGAALYPRVQKLAKLLQKQGLSAGDRIAIFSEHHPNWSIILLASTKLDATVIPLSQEFQTNEVLHILNHTKCKALFISSDLYEKIENIHTDSLTTLISIEDFHLIPFEAAKNKVGEILQQFSVELERLRGDFSRISHETAQEQLKTLLQKGASSLENMKEPFPTTTFQLARDRLGEILQYGSKELEKLKPNLSSDTARESLREVLQYGSRELEKLKDAALRMTQKVQAEVQENDLASIIYTSGTTGKSKGVMLTHKNIVSNALSSSEIISYAKKGEERFLSVLPLSHTYECTIGFIIPLMEGSCIYYLNKPPSARVLLPAMQKIRPTMMLTVPLIIEKIYKMRILPQLTGNALMRKLYAIPMIRKKLHKFAGKKLYKALGGKLHFFGIGGAPLSPEVETFLRDAGFPYAIGYGMTETSPLIAGTNARHTKFRSTGPAIKDVEIKIAHPNPETGEGEILVRGKNVMQGYYKAPVLTSEAFTEDGWFRTGDLGMLDQDEYLFIKGRVKNMILGPSGENIYPEEIEAIFNEQDAVIETLVYQQENKLVARVHLDYDKLDEEFGSQNLSESQIQQKIHDLLADLRSKVNARVSSFSKIHTVLEQPEPFEKTPTQKVKRYLYVNQT